MTMTESTRQQIEDDMWAWIHGFVTVKNAFYHGKFAPCPFAKQAVQTNAVDVLVWQSGNVRKFIETGATQMREHPSVATRVMAFPPRTQFEWGLSDYVERLNTELVASNVFLNTGVAMTTTSRYPGPSTDPYFIVVVNSLAAVLSGARSLKKTDYYNDWPAPHYALVVDRREQMAKQFGSG